MGLESHHAVDHVHAGTLERPGPGDVVLLVEPGPELDQCGHLLAIVRGSLQRPDDRAGAAGAVKRLLDGQDLRIVRRPLDEVHHTSEGLERMMHQHVLAPNEVEHITR